MAVLDEETIKRIKSQLRQHRRGMMISDLSRIMKINRNIMSRYLDILLVSGEVEMEMRGNAKVYTLSRRVPLSTMFDSSSDSIILLDGKGRMLWLNTAVLSLLGKTPEEFAGKYLSRADDPFLRCLPCHANPESGESVTEITCPVGGENRYYRIKQTPAVLADGSMGSIVSCEDITTERIFQQMVELSEARFRAIVEDQTDFIVRFLPDGTLSFANGAYARMRGRGPESLAGTPFFTGIPDEDIAPLRDAVQKLKKDDAAANIECRMRAEDGRMLRLQWTVRALVGSEGDVTEYQGVGRDITGKAEAEERLRRHASEMEFISGKAREFLELPGETEIYSAIAQGLSGLLPDAAISVNSLHASPADPRLYTMTIQAVCGRNAQEIFKRYTGIDIVGFSYTFEDPVAIEYIMREGLHKAYGDLYSCSFGNIPCLVCRQIEDALDLGQTYIHALASEGRLLGEVSIFTRKGTTIPNPRIVETFIRQASLVLAWRRAVEELRKSEARSRAIIEDQTEFVTRFLPDGTLTFVNRSFASLAGRQPEELNGTLHTLFLSGDELPKIRERLADLTPENEATVVECSTRCGNRGTCRQQWTVRALFDREGNVTEYQGVGRDITEQAESEESLRHRAADMEFISRKSREFLELPFGADIYAAIGEGLSELLPDAYLTISSADPPSTALTVRYVGGRDASETFRQIAGTDLFGITFTVNDPTAIEFMKQKGLHKAYGSLYNALFGQVPYLACRQIEETLDLDEIYVLGLVSQGQLLGDIAILPKKGSSIPNPGLVETYLHQASLVLAWRKADESLRKSEALFRAIVEDQTEFVTRFLPDGTLTYVNVSFARFMEKLPGDLVGTKHLPYIVDDVIPLIGRNPLSDNRDDPATAVQFSMLNPAGAVRWLQWTIRALPDGQGDLVEYQGVGRDITELHEAEESTRSHIASMEFLSRKAREFLEIPQSPDICRAVLAGLNELVPGATITVSSYDPHSGSIVVKGALPSGLPRLFCDLTGEELIGKSFPVSDADAIERMKSNQVKRIPGDLYYVMFGEIPMAVCRRIEDLCSMSGEKYAIGLVAQNRLLGTVLIVPRKGQSLLNRELIETFIRQASVALAQRLDAEALRESEARFRAMVEDQTGFVTRFLPDGTLTFVNAALCRAVDKEPSGLLGQSFFSMIPDENRREVITALELLSPENPEATIRHCILGPGRELRWFEWINRAVFDEKGRPVEYDGTGRDITELHEASSRIRKHPADIRFLSRLASGLAGIGDRQEILAFTARKIQSLIPGSLVGICSYFPESGEIVFRHIGGRPDAIGILDRETGKAVAGSVFPFDADPETVARLRSSHLVPGSGHIGMFFRSVSPDVCARISERLNLGRSYLMGLPSDDGTMDAVLIQLEAGSDLKNPELVEAAVNLAGLALAGLGMDRSGQDRSGTGMP